MAYSSSSFNTIAPLRNVMAFMTMLERLDARGAALPGMGCFYGPAGFGKTWSTIFAANDRELCVVQVKSVWTQKALCEGILADLGIKPERVIYKMVDQISEVLAKKNMPLVIDEADHLARKKSIEIIRDIYESSQVPVILVGEEALPSMLRRWERINSRLLARVAAEPIDEMDFERLARLRCPNREIAPDLVQDILKASRGSARLICNNLDTLDMECRKLGLGRSVGKRDVAEIDWHTGIAPDMRRFG